MSSDLGLKFTIDMILFDPMTGGTLINPRNGEDEITLNACRGAIEALQTEPCEDCISRQAVDDYISHWMSGYIYDEERTRLEDFSAWLWDELPSVTPQKVIRCKNCKYLWKEDGWDNLYCNRVRCSGSFAVEKDGFCAWAEREEGE